MSSTSHFLLFLWSELSPKPSRRPSIIIKGKEDCYDWLSPIVTYVLALGTLPSEQIKIL